MIVIWEAETVTFRQIIRKIIYPETGTVILKHLPAPGSNKCPKQSQNSPLESQNSLFGDSGDCFETVSDTFLDPAGDSFETLSGFRVRRARETPVRAGGVATLVSVGDLCPNSGECEGSSGECHKSGSPNFVNLRYPKDPAVQKNTAG